MKKLLFITLFLFAGFAFADAPSTAHIIKQQITVGPGQTSAPVFIPVEGKLQSIKICLAFDSPTKNVQVKGEIEDVWFGSVSQDCTTLDSVGLVSLPEESDLRLICRNFDAKKHICHVKVVYYTKNNS